VHRAVRCRRETFVAICGWHESWDWSAGVVFRHTVPVVHNVVLKFSCHDRVGLTSVVTGFCAERGINLLEVHQFTDQEQAWFFTRLEMEVSTVPPDRAALRAEVGDLAAKLGAQWEWREPGEKRRVALLVSRAGHCLADLLWRWRSGDLPMEVVGVISNHRDLEAAVRREELPFVHLPIDPVDKAAGFTATADQLQAWSTDTVVLARYMQIVPPDFCALYEGRMLNIHHSFLPSFAGAQPYRQAHRRGVKLIGATCHYVTPELDAGPIIEQEVVRVEHYHDRDDLVRLGQDCERLALARGLRYHLHDRVFVHGQKTVVFRD
jgi:formyltetrahydrofolate deformylase